MPNTETSKKPISVKSLLAQKRKELKELTEQHQAYLEDYPRRVAAAKEKFHALTGAIEALEALQGKTKKEEPSK